MINDNFILYKECQLLKLSTEIGKGKSSLLLKIRLAFETLSYRIASLFACRNPYSIKDIKANILQHPKDYLRAWRERGIEAPLQDALEISNSEFAEAVVQADLHHLGEIAERVAIQFGYAHTKEYILAHAAEYEKQHKLIDPRPCNLLRFGISEEEFSRALELDALHKLDQLAVELKLDQEAKGTGKKHQKIVELYALLQGVPNVHVPLPFGIKDQFLVDFLKKNAPQIFVKWEKLQELYQENAFLDQPEVKELLQQIESEINTAFAKTPADFFSKDALRWLAAVEKSNSFLMVRSTGDEDGTCANAGGNVSVNYVPPTPDAIFNAVKKVVASYFSKRSLKNRMIGKDNPFADFPKIGVTLQRLIGEAAGGGKNRGEIPLSAVLFTNEPDWGGNGNFRVMRINGTFGHGESVVGNHNISSDSLILLQSRVNPEECYALYDRSYKPQRLCPMGNEPKLETVDNAPDLAVSSAFTKEMIQRLFDLGKRVEGHYGEPTDMELVIKGETIYPVQARPINRVQIRPTYFDSPELVIKACVGKTVVPGESLTTIVDDPQRILVVDKLEDALSLFDAQKHQVIIIGEEEPPLSHPVIVFSGMGIPCLFQPDLEQVEDMLGSKDKKLVVCMQNQTLYLVENSPDLKMKEGYVSHPASFNISLDVDPFMIRAEDKKIDDIKALIKQIKTDEAGLKALKELKKAFRKHFDIDALKARVKKNPTPQGETNLAAFEQLEGKIARAIKECKKTLQAENPERLEILFHAKVLETLAAATSKLNSLIQGATEASLYQESLSQPAKLIEELSYQQECFDESVKVKWKSFLLALEKEEIKEEEIARFKSMLKTLKETGSLPIWMMLFFSRYKSFDALLNLYNPESEAMIKQLLGWQKKVQTMKRNQALFADPEQIQNAFQQLQTFIEEFYSPSFVKQFQSCTPLALCASIPLMLDIVELYDGAIKSMKGSRSFEDKEKGARFKEMVEGYFTLLKNWSTQLAGDAAFKWHFSSITNSPLVTLVQYLDQIKKILDKRDPSNPAELLPSQNFQVSEALMVNGTNIERHLPVTTEDVWTLIHQNLKAIVALFINRVITDKELAEIDLPPCIKKCLEAIKEGGHHPFNLTGISISSDMIKMSYTVPLANHSSTFELIYDKNKKQGQLKAKLLGQARTRWANVQIYLEYLSAAGIQPLSQKVKLKGDTLEWSWVLTEDLKDLIKNYEIILFETGRTDISNIAPYLIERCEKNHSTQKVVDWALGEVRNGRKSHLIPEFFPLISNGMTQFIFQSPLEAFRLFYPDFVHSNWVSKAADRINSNELIKMIQPLVDNKKRTANENTFLYTVLVNLLKRGDGYAQAEAVFKEFKYESYLLNKGRFEFIKLLLEKGQGFETAKKIAQEQILSQTEKGAEYAVWIYAQLLQKGEAVQEASVAAKTLLDQDQKKFSLELYKHLVLNGIAYQEAEEAARKNLFVEKKGTFNVSFIHNEAASILRELFKKKQALGGALQEELLTVCFTPWHDYRWEAYHLLTDSMKEGAPIEAVAKAAASANGTSVIKEIAQKLLAFISEKRLV